MNFGIWNAACFTARELAVQFGMQSELWFPASSQGSPQSPDCSLRALDNLSQSGLKQAVAASAIRPEDTIIISHGCWRFPTRWGAWLRQMGFVWMYVPHGMLEPWSLQQKRWRKQLYWHLLEKRLGSQASIVRAVGLPEWQRLRNRFEQCVWIPNGVSFESRTRHIITEKRIVLFMARLHHKKNVLPLAEAWQKSELADKPDYELWIAGPDDGEAQALHHFIRLQKPQNIHYIGAKYGSDKELVLRQASFFILPSQSEGFPTSVLEAMQFGLIPLISSGCNFPDLHDQRLAIDTGTDVRSITRALNQCIKLDDDNCGNWSAKVQDYLHEHYTDKKVAQQLGNQLLELHNAQHTHP